MWNLPNIITIIRIAMTPVIALLPFIQGYWPKLIAFVIFSLTALTDLVDGYLARSRGQVTDLGKLLDPLADKLLLLASLVPIYWIARERQDLYGIPFWGSIPLWVCLLLLGRELAGQRREHRLPARRRSPLHRGHTEIDAEEVRSGTAQGRLEYDSRGARSQVVFSATR